MRGWGVVGWDGAGGGGGLRSSLIDFGTSPGIFLTVGLCVSV